MRVLCWRSGLMVAWLVWCLVGPVLLGQTLPGKSLIFQILVSEECYHIQGRNWVILRWGRRYICNRKDKICVKCVGPLLETCP